MPSTDPRARSRRSAVVLDPGHGGTAPRGRSSANRVTGPGGTTEKEIVLDLARRTAGILRSLGLPVILTRDADVNRSLAERAATAREAGAAAFVSLHLGGPGAPSGPLTCVHPAAGGPSRALAARVQAALSEALARQGGPVEEAPLGVLDPALHRWDTACCLVEPLALSDPEGERRLRDPAFRDGLAGALGRAVGTWVLGGASAVPAGTTRIVVAGIDDYATLGRRLRLAGRDAVALTAALIACAGVDPAGVVLLRDAQATSTGILEALARLARGSGPRDALALVFAGVGTTAACSPGGLVAHDGVLLTSETLAAALEESPLGGLQVIADVGMAPDATVPGSRSVSAVSRPRLRPLAARGLRGRVRVGWLCAASPGQDAAEHEAVEHGLFTRALIEALRPPRTDISLGKLVTLLSRAVGALALEHGVILNQRPWTSEPGARLLAPVGAPPPQPLAPLRHTVPLVAQRTGMSCWVAAAAMLVGWRERQDVDGAEVARGAGRWEAYRHGLHPADVHALARAWGLRIEPARRYLVADLYALLASHGPLWVGEADPELHVVVVVGMSGDGTEDGTEVEITDPWPVGRGERYTLSFREFKHNLQTAGEVIGVEAQVLHTGGLRRHAQTPIDLEARSSGRTVRTSGTPGPRSR
ncbi:MAG: papain-like cysteine protease family protein [Pseudomonadota bacterium]